MLFFGRAKRRREIIRGSGALLVFFFFAKLFFFSCGEDGDRLKIILQNTCYPAPISPRVTGPAPAFFPIMQIAFNPALLELQSQGEGVRLEIIPASIFPPGKVFFDHEYVENYVQVYHEGVMIVHNNWLRGHGSKLARFKAYQLWEVGGVSFPDCGGR